MEDIKIGDKISIDKNICEEKGMSFLSDAEGIVTQVLDDPSRRNRGCIVRAIGINDPEKEWFVDSKYIIENNYYDI